MEETPPLRDGRLYDSWHRNLNEDLPFYLKQAERFGDPILEIGCGTGRVSLPLAERGFAVTGLERESTMLDRAEQKAAAKGLTVHWVREDIRNFQTAERFALVLYPFNTIGQLNGLEEIIAVFRKIRSLLTPNGRFVIDFFNPDFTYLSRRPDLVAHDEAFPSPDGAGNIQLTYTIDYDRARQISQVTFRFQMPDGRELTETLDMRIFFPQELDAYLRFAGFTIEHKFGDYDEAPFVSASPKQLIVARPAKDITCDF